MLDAGRDVKTNQNFTLQKQAENSSVSPPPSLGTAATPITPHLSQLPPGLGGTLHTTTSQVTVINILVIIVIVSMIVRCS